MAGLPSPKPTMKPPSASEVASDYIRTLIFTGVLRTGDRVPVNDIAEVLSLSRQPVREAIIGLSLDGLATASAKQGTFVGAFSAATVREHFEVLGLLEAHVARRAAERSTPELISDLRQLDKRLNATTDGMEFRRLSTEFQFVLNRAGATPRLRGLLRAMSSFVPGEFYLSHIPDGAHGARIARRGLIAAIRTAEPDVAAAVVIEQWRVGGEVLIEALQRAGVFSDQDTAQSLSTPPV